MSRGTIIVGILFVCIVPWVTNAQNIHADSAQSSTRSAPGENVSVRIQLSNFGSENRADARVTYSVIDAAGHTLATESETEAVETTSTFIHSFALPQSIEPGHYYTMQVSVAYQGQQTPAISSYQFFVERKVFGIFISDLLQYISIVLVTIILILGLVWIFERYHHRRNLPDTYSNIPAKVRVYYEIVGDIIHQMQLHEGDSALEIANTIEGLHIENTGKVSELRGDPAVIVATLVSEYEKTFGKHVNFCLGKNTNCRALVKDYV
jgi:hypothetical protein